MSNERTPDAPLTATLREELERKRQEGEPSGLDVAERAVADLEARGHGAPADDRPARERPDQGRAAGPAAPRPEPERRAAAGRAGLGWAIAAGLGTFVLAGMIRRAFGR